ncbi:MAG: RNA polymerase sigma factor FliA [Burkholderiaceae bacterium]|jgi:RNA polymerase sigma factor for flagellar operon FliA|nr:RNA polymerase sigma factor FliA [Burkholderiales bacterium]MCZ8103444.1 RNA polymerase sigma factor FliA [Burkholderiales bacterium]MCZ8339388.1 RNA polymerase sigma factor FliA [Burkholderiaceae bacterium]
MYTARGTLDRSAAVERYAPMVRRLASQLIARLPANVELDDLVQAGMIGLMDALSRYESGHGAQFETFAMQRIRGAMIDELRGGDWLPRSVRRNQRAIESAVHAVEQRLRRSATEAEVAAEMGVPLAQYQQMLGDSHGGQLLYLDEMVGPDTDESFVDRQPGTDATDPIKVLNDHRFRGALAAAIEALPEREKQVMGMYYEHDMNLKEIGAVLGVTESRVCQLHSQAVARLRTKMKGW